MKRKYKVIADVRQPTAYAEIVVEAESPEEAISLAENSSDDEWTIEDTSDDCLEFENFEVEEI